MLDQRLGNVEQDYASIYSFKMTVQDMIQRSSANRPKRKPPFYFDGGAYASYNLTEVALNLKYDSGQETPGPGRGEPGD